MMCLVFPIPNIRFRNAACMRFSFKAALDKVLVACLDVGIACVSSPRRYVRLQPCILVIRHPTTHPGNIELLCAVVILGSESPAVDIHRCAVYGETWDVWEPLAQLGVGLGRAHLDHIPDVDTRALWRRLAEGCLLVLAVVGARPIYGGDLDGLGRVVTGRRGSSPEAVIQSCLPRLGRALYQQP